MPTDVSNGIRRINDIRNALAHSLFPENRRRYMNEKNVTYRGTNLFSLEGIEKFKDDCATVEIWLHKEAFGEIGRGEAAQARRLVR